MTRLYAQELMQYDDRALDAYLATVNNVIQIHDAENLTPEFLERLRCVGSSGTSYAIGLP